MSNLRPKPLQPRGSVSTSPEARSSIIPRPHGKYVATACDSCKKAKRKCDGNQPCQTCVDKDVPCIYDEKKDGRRDRKRTLDDLYAKVEALDTVLDSIRSTDDQALSDLIRLIRSEAPIDEVAAHARAILRDKTRSDSRDRARNVVMSIASLTDEPIVYSDHPLVFATDHDNATRGLHFADEVTRLWADEEGRASLTTLQGLVALSMGLGIIRKDRLAMIYARHMPVVCIELSRKVRRKVKNGEQEYASDRYQYSLQLARWSAFTMEVDFSMIWVKPLELMRPNIRRPYTPDDLQRSFVWRPYPRTGPQTKFNPFGLYAAKFDLREIGADIVPVMLSGDPDDSPVPGHVVLDRVLRLERLQELHERLYVWRDALPTYAQLDTSTVPSWSLVELHLAFHDYCIAVCNLMLRDMVSTGSKRQQAKVGLLKSCEEIAEIFDWVHRTLGPTTVWCPWAFQAAVMAAYPLIDMLAEMGVPDTFHTVVDLLGAVAKRWVLARGVLKMLWIMLQDRKVVQYLNQSTIKLLKSIAVENWGPNDHRLFSSCMYPNYIAIGEQGRELADMGELLEQWSQLSVAEEGDSSLASG